MNTGIDIVECQRFKNKSQKFFDWLFLPTEIAFCKHSKQPHQTFAACFAVKEAVMKALGQGLDKIPFSHIEVCFDEQNQPFVVLHHIAKKVAKQQNFCNFDISISCTTQLASAICVAK